MTPAGAGAPASAPTSEVLIGKTGTTPVILPEDPFDDLGDEETGELTGGPGASTDSDSASARTGEIDSAPEGDDAGEEADGASAGRPTPGRLRRAGQAGARADGSPRAARNPRKRRRVVRVIVVTVLVLALVAFGAAAAGFTWLRWYSADDAADFQGTWYLAGTATPITITEDRIRLTDDVSYHYTLDPETKTFELTFGNLVGGGRYRFSLDRQELALVDGRFDGSDTLESDLSWTLRALVEEIQGNALSPEAAMDAGVTLLTRAPAKAVSGLPADNATSQPRGGDSIDPILGGATDFDEPGADSAADGEAVGEGDAGAGTGDTGSGTAGTGAGTGDSGATPQGTDFDSLEDR